MVARRGLQNVGLLVERHGTHAHLIRYGVEEGAGRLLGRGEPVGRQVRGEHRARPVGEDHHARLLGGHGDGGLRLGQRHEQHGQRDAVPGDHRVTPPARAAVDHGRHQALGRERLSAALAADIDHQQDRDQPEADQQQGAREAHARLHSPARRAESSSDLPAQSEAGGAVASGTGTCAGATLSRVRGAGGRGGREKPKSDGRKRKRQAQPHADVAGSESHEGDNGHGHQAPGAQRLEIAARNPLHLVVAPPRPQQTAGGEREQEQPDRHRQRGLCRRSRDRRGGAIHALQGGPPT